MLRRKRKPEPQPSLYTTDAELEKPVITMDAWHQYRIMLALPAEPEPEGDSSSAEENEE